MKATVQYDDFTGTAAADISDHGDLNKYLNKYGVNTERYDAVGVDFYSGLRNCSFSIICIDRFKSTDFKRQFVKVHFSRDRKWEDFFILFKRFRVILMDKNYSQDELNEHDTIELSKTEYSD
jgi:hypothetical protein